MTSPPPPPQVDDPFADARERLLQALAVLATIGEAAARWHAINVQNQAAAEEQATPTQQQAHQRAAHMTATDDGAQAWMDAAFTDWLDHADFHDTAHLWRTAAVHASHGHPRAEHAMRRAEDRLRQVHPQFMADYTRHRAAGDGPVDAMRAAAYDLWERDAAAYPPRRGRPHGATADRPSLRRGAAGTALPAGGQNLHDLDAAVRAEAAQLAHGVSPEALDTLQRTWRQQGRVPAADAAALLAQYASDASQLLAMPDIAAAALAEDARRSAKEQRQLASLAGAVADDPATPVDEHTTGQNIQRTDHLDAAHDDIIAASTQRQIGTQAFPVPPLAGGKVAVHVAGKQPATVVAARRRGKGR